MYGDLDAAGESLAEFGADSNVFRTWSKIHADFKSNSNGKKTVLVNGGGRGTILVPWHGPKVLDRLKEIEADDKQEPTAPMAGWTMTENTLDLNVVRVGERYYDKEGSAYIVEAVARNSYAEMNPLDESGNPLGTPGRGVIKVSSDRNSPDKFKKLVNLQDSGKYSDGVAGYSESKAIKDLPASGAWPKAVSAQITYYDEANDLKTIELVAPLNRLTDAKRIEVGRQLWAFTGKDPKRFEDVPDRDKLQWINQRIMRRSNFSWKTDEYGVSFTHDSGSGGRKPGTIKLVDLG